METYEKGGHAYHATLPTDALTRLRAAMQETKAYGFAKVMAEQLALGSKVRALFEGRGLPSVAAEGFKAPGVVVSYTTDADIQSGKKFLNEGLQTAAGVPLLLLDPTSLSRQNLLQRADPNKPHVNQSRFNRQLQTAHHVVQLH